VADSKKINSGLPATAIEGEKGPRGHKGHDGSTGPTGPTGSASSGGGTTGPTGPAGAGGTGPTGATGPGAGGSAPTLTVTGEVVTADLAGATFNDFNPPGFDGLASTLMVTNSNPNSVITGLLAQPVGRVVWIVAPQTNGDRFLISDNDGGSAPNNQFQLPNSEGWYLEPGSVAAVRYNGTLLKWLPIGFWSAGMASLHVLGPSLMDAGLSVVQSGITVTGPNAFVHAEQEGDFGSLGGGIYSRRKLVETAAISPVAITGAHNDYAPVDALNPTQDLSQCRVVRQDLSGAANLTGLVAPNAFNRGQRICIRNLNAALSLTLNHENVGSAAGNRFNLPGGASLVLTPFSSVDLWYDPLSLRWVVM
jgi:hypothetical protein